MYKEKYCTSTATTFICQIWLPVEKHFRYNLIEFVNKVHCWKKQAKRVWRCWNWENQKQHMNAK